MIKRDPFAIDEERDSTVFLEDGVHECDYRPETDYEDTNYLFEAAYYGYLEEDYENDLEDLYEG